MKTAALQRDELKEGTLSQYRTTEWRLSWQTEAAKKVGTATSDDRPDLEKELYYKPLLKSVMESQLRIVRQAVEEKDFDGISRHLSHFLHATVILFDRFLRPVSIYPFTDDAQETEVILQLLDSEKERIIGTKTVLWLVFQHDGEKMLGIWPVMGKGALLGYLCVRLSQDELDEIQLFTIEMAVNICAVQFIKQKLTIETNEKLRENCINQLFVRPLRNEEEVLKLANLYQWDIFKPHRVAVLACQFNWKKTPANVPIDKETYETWLWDQIKEKVAQDYKELILTRKDDHFILIIPEPRNGEGGKDYWTSLYQYLEDIVSKGAYPTRLYLGVGNPTEKLEDYYDSYQQALQALNVVLSHRVYKRGYALFEDLGVYNLLHHLTDSGVAINFVKEHLEPLLKYTNGHGADLFNTLRIFLENSGNWKATTEQMYIHRSTLKYRLQKIEELLGKDLNDGELRLNLMLAYKLYDLYYISIQEN